MSKAQDKALDKAKKEMEIHRVGLEEAKKRLLDVETRGNDAISDHDLRMGYDADFYLVRCPLLANHVKWHSSHFFWAKKLVEDLEGKTITNQLNLFNGNE